MAFCCLFNDYYFMICRLIFKWQHVDCVTRFYECLRWFAIGYKIVEWWTNNWNDYFICWMIGIWVSVEKKGSEVLCFNVCLQKDAKQCCDKTKLDCTHCSNWSYLCTIHVFHITTLFVVFFGEKVNKWDMRGLWLLKNKKWRVQPLPGFLGLWKIL